MVWELHAEENETPPMAKEQSTIFLPVLERELRVLARKKLTYHLRWMTAGVTLLVGSGLWFAMNDVGIPGGPGKQIFLFLSILGLIFSLLEGVRLACDSISKETREGTLGLLFLTDLKGHDIIAGKVGACSLTAFYGVLATLPVLGISLLMGGLMFGELFRVGVVLVQALFYSISLSLLVSAYTREENRSLLGALLAVGGMTVVLPHMVGGILPMPLDEWITWISPFTAYGYAIDSGYRVATLNYWGRMIILTALSFLSLWLAGRRLRQTWMKDKTSSTSSRSSSLAKLWRQPKRSFSDSSNPIFELACQRRLKGLWVALMMIFTLYLVLSNGVHLSFSLTLGLIALKVSAAWMACVDFQKAKQCGALELWLTSPLTVPEIIAGKRQSMRRWLWISITLVGVTMLIYWWQLTLQNSGGNTRLFYMAGSFGQNSYPPGVFTDGFDTDTHNFMVLGMVMIVFVADMLVMIWLGMWQGLAARSIVQAVAKTYYWVILLPWLLMFIPQIFFLFGGGFDPGGHALQAVVVFLTLVIDLAFIIYAKRKLRNQFRNVAAEAFIRKPVWWERWLNRLSRRPPPITA